MAVAKASRKADLTVQFMRLDPPMGSYGGFVRDHKTHVKFHLGVTHLGMGLTRAKEDTIAENLASEPIALALHLENFRELALLSDNPR